MFDHCIQAMTAEQSDVVMDLMEKGPSTTCFADLKTAYIERHTPSTSERVQRLRKLGPLTSDQRPSDLLRLIERILGRAIDEDEIAKDEFLRRLPAQTQLIIRAQTGIFTVGQLAQMPDRPISVPVISQVCAISQLELSRDEDAATLMSINQQLSRLTATNDRISGEVAELQRSSAFSQSGNRRSRAAEDNSCQNWKKTASLLGASTNTTTSYHPQANGMVERMHRTMKSALKAKLGADANWVDALPIVMLGMHAAVKNDLHCSAAEMVFGESLRLPGEFFVSSDGNWTADPAFVADLRQKIRQLRPVPPVWHGGQSRRSYVPQELASATHLFVRVDAHKRPLQAPYQGPLKVLEKHEKYFKLDLGSRQDIVSLDRLKPAFMEASDESGHQTRVAEPRPQARPHCRDEHTRELPRVTSSGRLVRLPVRYGVTLLIKKKKNSYLLYGHIIHI